MQGLGRAIFFLVLGASLLGEGQGRPKEDLLGEPSKPLLDFAFQKFKKIPGAAKIIDEHLGDLVPRWGKSAWNHALEAAENQEDNSLGCWLCRAGAWALGTISQNYEWHEMENTTIDLCKELLLAMDENTLVDIICPGVIQTQGPPLHYVFTQLDLSLDITDVPNPLTFCENQNLCFPPKDDVTQAANEVKAESRSERSHQWRVRHPAMSRLRSGHRLRSRDQPLTVVQLTDIHLDPHYAVGAATDCGAYVCCRENYPGEGEAGEWGDYECNTPQRTIDHFLEEVDKMKPDFIIYSGDTPPHTIWEETFDSQLECSELLAQSLTDYLGDYKIYPNVGNHEMYPTNLYYAETNDTVNMAKALAELWQPLAGFEEDQMRTMEIGSYYSMLAQDGLRIISFNTNYWYTTNWYNTLNEIDDKDDAMWDALDAELEKATNEEEKVILIGHHPPGGSTSAIRGTRRFADIVLKYSDIIVLHVAGHTHRDDFRLIKDATGEAKVVVHVTPAMTPRGRMNPSARIFELDQDTFELLEMHQYYFDLETAMVRDDKPEIVKAYTSSEVYNMPDLSPESYDQLTHDFEENDELFQQFFYHYNGQTRPGSTCTGSCKTNRICQMRNHNYDEYSECTNAPEPTEPPPTPCPTFPDPPPCEC